MDAFGAFVLDHLLRSILNARMWRAIDICYEFTPFGVSQHRLEEMRPRGSLLSGSTPI